MDKKITYLPEPLRRRNNPTKNHKVDLQKVELAGGYCRNFPSAHEVFYNNRWYRVYITCISNCGSWWIKCKGSLLHLRDFHEFVDEELTTKN